MFLDNEGTKTSVPGPRNRFGVATQPDLGPRPHTLCAAFVEKNGRGYKNGTTTPKTGTRIHLPKPSFCFLSNLNQEWSRVCGGDSGAPIFPFSFSRFLGISSSSFCISTFLPYGWSFFCFTAQLVFPLP